MKRFAETIKAAISETLRESLRSVLPIVLVIIALCFLIIPMANSTFLGFIIGAVLLVIGMSLFNLGAATAMTPIGERIGVYLTKKRNLPLLIAVALVMGIFITISEPDLQVLANQIPEVGNWVLLISVGVGVGLFLVIGLLRMLFNIPINYIFLGSYALVFILAIFVPNEYLSVAFDAGGVTTGPMTVPFILALGVGVASIRSDEHASEDSFGLVGLCSVGPILTVMILGLVYKSSGGGEAAIAALQAENSMQMFREFTGVNGFLNYAKEVALALAPIFLFFLAFQIFAFRMKKRSFIKILIGLVYTFVGLVLFLTGVNVGFMPAGYELGFQLAGLPYNWVLVPLAMLIGYFIVSAEPAVHLLNKQVEEISSGAIPAKAMNMSLSIGMCVSLGLSMVRLMFHISMMWFLVPGYIIALALTFFVPKIFTAIAFDSGGVATGPMTATFLLPFAIGVCTQLGGNVMTEAFGMVAMVAMTPLITVQIMGLVYKIRSERSEKAQEEELAAEAAEVDQGIID